MRELRGIGPGIEARLRELVETGEIAELAELERELAPGLVGLGRYLGLSAQALGRDRAGARRPHARTSSARRPPPAGCGPCPGIGPKTEAQLLEALAREAEPRAAARAAAQPRPGARRRRSRPRSAGRSAGDVRRWRDSCERLAVVCAAADPAPVLARFAALPQIVAVVEQEERRAVGVTVEGVPGRARRRRAGALRDRARARDGLARLRRGARAAARRARRGGRLRARSGSRGARRSCARRRSAASRRRSSSSSDIRGDLHCHTTWSDGRASVEEMGRAARDRGYDYLAICDHTPAVGAVRGLTARRRPPPGRGDRGRQRAARAVPRPARDRVRHPPRRPARPPRRRPRGARLGAGERPRRPADAAARR